MRTAEDPPRKRLSLMQMAAIAVTLLLGGAASVALSNVSASAATDPPDTAPETCQVTESYVERQYSYVEPGTTETTHEEWRFRTRVERPDNTVERKFVQGYDFVSGGQVTVNGHTVSGHWVVSAGWHQIPDSVINAYWGSGGINSNLLGGSEANPKGNVPLNVYGGPNVSVPYYAYETTTSGGYTDWGPWSAWSTTNPGSASATKEVEYNPSVGDGNGTPDVTHYYNGTSGGSTNIADLVWTETDPGSPWVEIAKRDQTRLVDGPCPPSVTLTGVAECDTSTGTYQVTYTGTAVNADPDTAEIDIKVIDTTPSGTLINGQSGQVWLYEWVEHYANHNLPPFPVGGQFTFLQTGIPGTATSASATIQYDYKGGPSGDPKATVELGGDCTTDVNWEVCTTFAAPTTVYTMDGWPVTDIRAPGVGEINDDQPRSGFGSLLLSTPTNPAKVQYVQPVEPFPLSELIQMEYETYATATTVALPSLQLRYTSESKGLTGDFNFIAYEPYVDQGNAAIVPNTWQHWDAYRGGDALIWSNRGATLGIATQGAPVTFKELNDAVGDIMVTGYVINRGSFNAGDAQYVDNVGFAKKGEACGVDNFEPKPTVVTPTPTGSVEAQCIPEGTGAQATVTGSNPAPTAPNTVGEDVDFEVQVNGDVRYTATVAPGSNMTPYNTTFPEDSGTYLIELYDVTDPLNPVLLDSATVDSNCADDVITTPAKLVPTPPTCLADGKPPVVPSTDGLHYTTKISAPSGTGPWMYTIVDTADEGYTFADSKYQVYGVTVYPKLTENCGLAYTGVALEKTTTLAAGLFIIGFIAVMWQRRRRSLAEAERTSEGRGSDLPSLGHPTLQLGQPSRKKSVRC